MNNNWEPNRVYWWRIRLLPFVYYAAYGAGVPFYSVYYRSILQNPDGTPVHVLIGLTLFLQSILGILATPIAGFLADKFKIGNRLLAIFALLVSCGALLTTLPGLPIFAGWTLRQRVPFLISGVVLIGLFIRPIMPLIDTEILKYVHKLRGHNRGYGRIRTFGALGWCLSACLLGFLIFRFGRLNLSMIGYALLFLCLALAAKSGFRAEIQPVRIPWEKLRQDKTFQHFLFFSFLVFFGFTNSFLFTSYFLADARINYFIIGLAMGFGGIAEMPVLIANQFLLERIGNRRMIVIGSLVQAVKLVGILLVINSAQPWLVIVVQCFTGLGFALLITGSINLIDTLAHPDLRSTYQSLFSMSSTLATAFGALFASFIIKRLNSSYLMALDAGVIVLAVLYFLVFLGKQRFSRSAL